MDHLLNGSSLDIPGTWEVQRSYYHRFVLITNRFLETDEIGGSEIGLIEFGFSV